MRFMYCALHVTHKYDNLERSKAALLFLTASNQEEILTEKNIRIEKQEVFQEHMTYETVSITSQLRKTCNTTPESSCLAYHEL